MVKAAVTQVRARRNGAPYVFIGVSSGGFVAWEMARCLLASGERVNLVGLIDTRRPITRLTPRLNIHPLHSIIAELSGRLAFLLSRTARVLGPVFS
jgi:thioesterase domain-containing protein